MYAEDPTAIDGTTSSLWDTLYVWYLDLLVAVKPSAPGI